jgi:hypothetical protein
MGEPEKTTLHFPAPQIWGWGPIRIGSKAEIRAVRIEHSAWGDRRIRRGGRGDISAECSGGAGTGCPVDISTDVAERLRLSGIGTAKTDAKEKKQSGVGWSGSEKAAVGKHRKPLF